MLDLTPTKVDPELTSRLGQIVIRWSSVDAWISALLATLVNGDHGAMILITNNLPTATQTRWIRGLMKLHPQEVERNKRVLRLLERADKLRGQRNELIHGLWDTTDCAPKTAMVQTINLERSEPVRSRLVTIEELNGLVVQIDEWIADYIKLGHELGFPRHPGKSESIFSK